MKRRRLAIVVVMLLPALARAVPAPVAACVAKAEGDPKTFSHALGECLGTLSGPLLVEGLTCAHAKPAVTNRIRDVVKQHLCFGHIEHTPASVRLWLTYIVSVPDSVRLEGRDFRLTCLDRLGDNEVERAALRDFIGAQPRGPLRERALRMYLRASTGRLSSRERRRLAEYGKEADAAEAEDARVDRVIPRIREALRIGNPPFDEDLEKLWVHSTGNKEAFDLLLALLGSDILTIRDAALGKIWIIREPKSLPLFDLGRLGALLLEATAREGQPFSDQTTVLLTMTEKVSREEAPRLFTLAESFLTGRAGRTAGRMLVALANRFEELRPRVVAQLFVPDPRAAASVYAADAEWLQAPARTWVQTVTDDQLKDEATQERFLILSRGLSVGMYTSARLPETRLAHPKEIQEYCGEALPYLQARQIRWMDLQAFGLPPDGDPEELLSVDPAEWVPPAPPLTPMEKTLRWQHFVLVRPLLKWRER